MVTIGYTHYWSQRQPEITDGQWRAIRDDARKLIEASPAPIGDAFGESPAWIIDSEKIVFNGMGADSHETFVLHRRGQDHFESWMDRSRNPWGFMFCKTARKPYDAVVCGVLMSAYRHAPGWQRITSDGYADETIWIDAHQFTTRVLGPGYVIPGTVERNPRQYDEAHSTTVTVGDSVGGSQAESPGDTPPGRVFARVLSTLSSGLREGLYFSEFEERALLNALGGAADKGVTEQMAYGIASEIVAEHHKFNAFPGKSLALLFCERIEEMGRTGSYTRSAYAGLACGARVRSPYGSAEIRYVSEDCRHAVIRLEGSPGGERWVAAAEIIAVAA